MPRHRRGRRLTTSVLLASVKGATLCTLLSFAALSGASGTPSGTPSAQPVGPDATGAVAQAVADHECSTTGFEAGMTPASALIRTDQGRLRQVSFEVGWDVYTGKRPGTLVAVCLDET